MFSLWNSKWLERTEAWLCCRAQSFSAGLKVHCCFCQWLPSSCSVLLYKILCCCAKPAPGSSGACSMRGSLLQICFIKALQAGTALIALGRYFESHFYSQWWETSLWKGSIPIQWLIPSWQSCGPGKQEAGKGCLPKCLGPVTQEGGAWAYISCPKLLRILCMLIAMLEKFSQNV